MHKPIRIIKDDARVRLTQQVNLVSALRVALLTLPDKFDERRLFERMAGFSYAGDPRMSVPGGENRGKVANIVSAQAPQFRELYQRLANGLPSVHWRVGSSTIEASSLVFFFVDMSTRSQMSYFFFFCSKTLLRVLAPPCCANSPQTSSAVSKPNMPPNLHPLAPKLHHTRMIQVPFGPR
jgi:hypothetical protein